MGIAIIILATIAAAETVWLWLLWRQNLAICGQLAFIREHDSAMRVSVNEEMLGELALATEINKTLDDVRDRKHAMSEREKLIADAYANLSHDIRTPLTSLDGYVQLLRDAKTEADRERYTAIIGERIGTMKELLEDLFTFTKLKNEASLLTKDEVYLVAGADHPLGKRANPRPDGVPWVSLKDAVQYPFVLSYHDTMLGTIARNLFQKHKLKYESEYDNISAAMAVAMAKAGVGLAFTYASCVDPDDHLQLFRIGEKGVFLDLGVARPSREFHSKATEALEAVVREVYQKQTG